MNGRDLVMGLIQGGPNQIVHGGIDYDKSSFARFCFTSRTRVSKDAGFGNDGAARLEHEHQIETLEFRLGAVECSCDRPARDRWRRKARPALHPDRDMRIGSPCARKRATSASSFIRGLEARDRYPEAAIRCGSVTPSATVQGKLAMPVIDLFGAGQCRLRICAHGVRSRYKDELSHRRPGSLESRWKPFVLKGIAQREINSISASDSQLKL